VIAAVSELKPARYPQYDSFDIYRAVVQHFLREWRVKKSEINGLIAAPTGMAFGGATDVLTHERLFGELGLQPSYSETICVGGATYSSMVQRAALAIERGLADSILCVGAGKFPSVRNHGAEGLLKVVSHPEFEYLYGPTIHAIYAQVATRHMAEFGTTKEQLAQVAVSTRKWALKNPEAMMFSAGELTISEVLSSRSVASPFTKLQCSIPCEGGGAVLVTTQDVARRINPSPAHLLGWGEHHSHGYISQAPSLTTLGAKRSAELAYAMAGLQPSDVDVAEIYDAFSINPITHVEDLGFCSKGTGGAFFEDGRTEPGGALPINTNGGLLSFGHVGDASGMSVVVEGARQAMGRAGQRTVPGAEVVLVHTYGGMMSEHSTLLLGSHG
jgi:acetyl-CoA acetyltransferase